MYFGYNIFSGIPKKDLPLPPKNSLIFHLSSPSPTIFASKLSSQFEPAKGKCTENTIRVYKIACGLGRALLSWLQVYSMCIHLSGVCVGVICDQWWLRVGLNGYMHVYCIALNKHTHSVTIMLGFHTNYWGVSAAAFVFLLRMFVCVFSHNLCALALLEFLSRCATNNRLLKYSVAEYTHQLSVLFCCTHVAVCAYIYHSHLWSRSHLPCILMPFPSAPPHSARGGGRNKQVIQTIAHTC